jgi:hypothetical protein
VLVEGRPRRRPGPRQRDTGGGAHADIHDSVAGDATTRRARWNEYCVRSPSSKWRRSTRKSRRPAQARVCSRAPDSKGSVVGDVTLHRQRQAARPIPTPS